VRRIDLLQRGPSGADDEGGEALAELRIRNADHCHVGDLWQNRYGFLDGPREHVLAAGDDHLVIASGDEQPAACVEVPEIACVHQPVLDRG
jgi:hypothetical protein